MKGEGRREEPTFSQRRSAFRQEAIAALRESEVKYRTLFEAAGDAILIMEGERFLECNPKALEFFGAPKERLIGATPYEHFSPPLQPDGRPSREAAKEKIAAALNGDHQLFEWRHQRLDGTLFDAQVSLTPLNLGDRVLLLAIVRDVTAQKQMAEALRASEQKYRELVQNANSIILRWDREGKITFINEYGQDFFGYPEAELIGRHVVGTIVPERESTGRDLRSLMDQICADPQAFEHNVNENMRRDGSRVWIAWYNKAILDEEGGLREIFSVGIDITQRKQAEEELQHYREHLEELVRERTRELEEANRRLQEADRLKSIFLASMSHELRTPLNSIIGFTGIILQGMAGEINEEQKRQLTMVKQSANHLLDLINDLLDISKIEAGKVELAPEDFRLEELVREVVGSFTPAIGEKDLQLVTDAPEGIALFTDRRRLKQVLVNLVGNAVKYTDRGKIKVTARSIGGERVEISVTDTGRGIKEEDMGRLFEPFQQLDTSLTKKHEGTGLGLYLCKKVTRLLGGEVSAASEYGKGSTFTITIPSRIQK